jgi:hypothetical protein
MMIKSVHLSFSLLPDGFQLANISRSRKSLCIYPAHSRTANDPLAGAAWSACTTTATALRGTATLTTTTCSATGTTARTTRSATGTLCAATATTATAAFSLCFGFQPCCSFFIFLFAYCIIAFIIFRCLALGKTFRNGSSDVIGNNGD